MTAELADAERQLLEACDSSSAALALQPSVINSSPVDQVPGSAVDTHQSLNFLEGLKNKLAESEATVARLTACAEDLKEAVQRKVKIEADALIKDKIYAFDGEIKECRSQLSSALNEKNELQVSLSHTKIELQTALKALKEKSDSSEALSLQLHESTTKLQLLESAVKEAGLRIELLEASLARTADLEAKLKRAEVSLVEASEAASLKENDASLIEFAVSAANSRANEFEAQAKKLLEEANIANSRIKSITEELLATRAKVREFESLLAASQASLSRAQKDLENATSLNSSQLASQAESYNQRLDSVQKDAAKASSTYTAEMGVMRSRLVELQNKAVEVQGRATEFQSKTVDLQTALDESEERCKELQARVADAQSALEGLEKAAADASGERDKVELAARMALQAEYELRLSDAKSKIIVLDAQLAMANAQSTDNEVAATDAELSMLREAVREAQARESVERERALNAVSAAEAAAAQMNKEAEESKKLREKNVVDSQRFAQLEGNRRARAGTASSYSPAPQPQLGVQSAQVAAVKLIQGQFGPGGIFGVERSSAPPTSSQPSSSSLSTGPAKPTAAPSSNASSSLASVMRSASSFMSSVPSITVNSSSSSKNTSATSQTQMQQRPTPSAMLQSRPVMTTPVAAPKVVAKTFDPANPFG